MAASPGSRTNLAFLIAGLFGLVYVLAALAIARGPGIATTYAGRSVVGAWLFVTAGLALIAAGLLTIRNRLNTAVLSVLAGCLWFAPVWEGWEGGPAFVRTVGMLAAGFVFPVLVNLVLAAAGQPMSRAAVTLVGATYLLIGLSAVVVVLIRDPYLDPYCWANCTTNFLAVDSRPQLAQQIGWIQLGVAAVSALVLTVMCALRLAKGAGPAALRHWLVLTGGALLGGATVAYGILRRQSLLEDPGHAGYAAVFIVRCTAVILISLGMAEVLLDVRRQRRSVARIVAELDQTPPVGALDSALARALGDPGLRVYYWLPAAGHYADAHGRPVPDPSREPTATTTSLVRNGRPVAVVAHLSDPAELERALGSAVRLALDNERLQADMLVRMHQLAESRGRIVAAADVRRQSLERNLHDGAQQSLLGLSLDLRLARSTVEERGDAKLAALLGRAIGDVGEAVEELRDLAHGIFPATLSAAGLCAAVASLGVSAPLSVDVDCALDERLPFAVETAGYAVVTGGLEAATSSSAHRAAVSISRESDSLVVEVTHDGTKPSPGLVHIADRVGAAGGRLVVAPNQVTAEIPCVS